MAKSRNHLLNKAETISKYDGKVGDILKNIINSCTFFIDDGTPSFEGHNHDDRYYLKSFIDANFYTASYISSHFSNISHTHIAADVSDFSEAVDDRISVLVENGTGLSWSYNDTLNKFTPTVSLSPFNTDQLAQGASNLYVNSTEKSNWNTAYSWGDHASAGYIKNGVAGDWQIYSASTNTSYVYATLELYSSYTLGYSAPRLSFHWGGLTASQITTNAWGAIQVVNGYGNAFEDFAANGIYSSDWFRNSANNTGLYNSYNNTYFYSPASNYWTVSTDPTVLSGGLLFRKGHEGALKGYIYWDGDGFGLLHSGGGWSVRSYTYTGGGSPGGALYGNWNMEGNLQMNSNYLQFDQTGTRSWSIRAGGGTLNIASGDGLGAYNFDNNIYIGGGNQLYFSTYGGGWYMSDTTWLRSVSSKSIWTGDGVIGSNGGLSIGYGGSTPIYTGAVIAGPVFIGTTTDNGDKFRVYGTSSSQIVGSITNDGSGTFANASMTVNASGGLTGAITAWGTSSVRAGQLWVQTVGNHGLVLGTNDTARASFTGSGHFTVFQTSTFNDTVSFSSWGNITWGSSRFQIVSASGVDLSLYVNGSTERINIASGSEITKFLGANDLFFNTNQSAVVGLPAGSSFAYEGNFSLYSNDGVSGKTLGLYYWNGSTYNSALSVANVSSGTSILNLMSSGGKIITNSAANTGEHWIVGGTARINGNTYLTGNLTINSTATLEANADQLFLSHPVGELFIYDDLSSAYYLPMLAPGYLVVGSAGELITTSTLGAYLPLTGGTLSGALFGTTATFSGAVKAGSGSTGGFYNSVYVSGINNIWAFANAPGYGIAYKQGTGGWLTSDTIRFDVSGNLGNQSIPADFEITPYNAWVGGALVWHEFNDGHLSGLDADLLDGYHASHFAIAVEDAYGEVTGNGTFSIDDTNWNAVAGGTSTGVQRNMSDSGGGILYDGTETIDVAIEASISSVHVVGTGSSGFTPSWKYAIAINGDVVNSSIQQYRTDGNVSNCFVSCLANIQSGDTITVVAQAVIGASDISQAYFNLKAHRVS